MDFSVTQHLGCLQQAMHSTEKQRTGLHSIDHCVITQSLVFSLTSQKKDIYQLLSPAALAEDVGSTATTHTQQLTTTYNISSSRDLTSCSDLLHQIHIHMWY